MKKLIKPILLAISILIITASTAGCADSEKASDNNVVNTENTSTSSSSAEESVISSTTTTNSYDTSKPIDTTTPPASSSSSSTTSEPEESSTNSGSGTGTGEGTNSSSNSTPSSSSSSSSSTSTTKPTEKPSSSSGTGAISPITGKPITITIPVGTPGEYFDQYGNPMPDGFDPSKGGYYNRYGDYNMTPEEKAAMDRALQEACDKIDNGTLDPTAGMTQEEADELWNMRH